MSPLFAARLAFVAGALMASAAAFATPAEDMLGARNNVADLVAMCDAAKNTPPAKEGGKPTLDPVAYEALLIAYKDGEPSHKDFYRPNFRTTIAAQAMRDVLKKYNKPKLDKEAVERLLTHASPLVRAEGVRLLSGGWFGTAEANRKRGIELMAVEKDPVVLAALASVFGNDGCKDGAIGKFLLDNLSHADPVVRTTTIAYASSSWNAKLAGLPEKFADMLVNEADDDVRTQIRQYAGKIGAPMLVEAYEKAWETSKSKSERDATLRGIGAMWWGWPLFSYSVEPAYRLHMKIMDAYKAKPYDGGFMAINALGNFPVSSSNRSFAQWKSQASYYKPEEVQAVAKAVLMNNKSDWLSRNSAIQVMWTHGVNDKAVLEKLVDEIQASGDTDFNVKSFRRTITNLRPAN